MSAQPAWIDDITIDELETNPYPIWARLRREAPVAYVPAIEGWFMTRRDDVISSRRKPAIGVSTELPRMKRTLGMPNVLMVDGPTHTDLRTAIDPLLLPKAVPTYADEMIRPVAKACIQALPDDGEVELMEIFEMISSTALGRLVDLDVPGSTVRHWFRELAAGIANVSMEEELFARSDKVVQDIVDVVDPVLDRLEREPDNGMLSHMLHAGRPEGEPRPRDLVYPSILVIITGGAQEPGHLAGTAINGLLSKPEQLSRVMADWSLIPRVMDEGLRWEAMFPIIDREALEDIEICGRTIPAGDLIEVCVGSANRDETHFTNADQFDLDRQEPAHLAFGLGAHICAGRNFGREVARISLEELFSRYSTLSGVPTKPAEVRGFAMRAPKTLHVAVT